VSPRRGRARSTGGTARLARYAGALVVLVLWEVIGRQNEVFLSYPTAVLRAAWEILVLDDELRSAFGETLHGYLVGYVVAMALGTTIGFAMGRIKALDVALAPYVNALYATPRIALIPLLVLWVGIGYGMRLTIVILSAVFPIIITVRDGAKSVAAEYLDVANSFVATGWQTWRTTILPGSLPYVFSAFRIGAQRSLIGIIVAETLAAVTGTGRMIQDYGQFFQTDRLLVPILVIGFFSIFMTALLNLLQRIVTPWDRA
jgi:ABC-type nitrate/sulfonate/bicarbonate transport system permease component